MRMTNEEFKAEVFRRKELYEAQIKKQRKRALKSVAAVLTCVPLFLAVCSFSISFLLCGGAKSGDAANKGMADMKNIVYIELECREESYGCGGTLEEEDIPAFVEFLEKITLKNESEEDGRPEYSSGTNMDSEHNAVEPSLSDADHVVSLRDANGIYAYVYVYKEYIYRNGRYFYITDEEYNEFLSIIGE